MISYEVHTTMTGLVNVVTNFIQEEEDVEFVGSWMMVTTFQDLPLQDATKNDVRIPKSTCFINVMIHKFCFINVTFNLLFSD